MKFFGATVLALAAVAAAQSSSTSSSAAATGTSVVNQVDACIKASNCNGNVNCIANCALVPFPTEDDMNNTISCVGACDQKSADYSDCVQGCIKKNVPVGSGTPASASSTATSTDGTSTGSSNNNGTTTDSSEDGEGAASVVSFAPMAAIAAIVAALL